jgi:hypothetical protein
MLIDNGSKMTRIYTMTYSICWTDSEALAMGTCCFVAKSVTEVYKRFRLVYGESARITSLRVDLV